MLAREIGIAAATWADHTDVMLYADFPYVIAYGWPRRLTGQPPVPYLDADHWLTQQLTAAGLEPAALRPAVTRLDRAQRTTKAAVIAAYQSQASALRLDPGALALDPGKLDFELSWRMTLTPTVAPTQASGLCS